MPPVASALCRAAVLACLLPAAAAAQSSLDQSLATLQARLGPDISPDERAYFGLFYPFREGFRSAEARVQGDALVIAVRATRGTATADTTYRLPADDAALLARYVDGYERLFFDGVAVHADDLSTLIRRRLARPASLPEGALRPVRVETRAGQNVEGGLLYASETYWALWPGAGPYTWTQAQRVIWIPAADIRDARAPSGSAGLRIGELAANAGMQVAAALPGAFWQGNRFAGPAIATASTAGAVALLLRVRGARPGAGRSADPLPGARPLLRMELPPELRDARAALPESRPRASFTPRLRRTLVHATVGTSFSPTSSGGAYQTRATGTGSNFPNGPATYAAEAKSESARSGLHFDVQVNPLAFAYVGAEGSFVKDADAPPYGEALEGLRTLGAFAGVSLNSRSGHVLSLGGGVQEVRAHVRGRFYSTLAFPVLTPEKNPATVYSYDVPTQVRRPFGRVAYEYVLSDLSSFFAKATIAPNRDAPVPRQAHQTSTLSNTFAAERPAHRVSFASSSVLVGLRLRL